MDERLTTKVRRIQLRDIKTDPFFVPQSLHIKKYFNYDKDLAEKYFSLLEDCGFQSCLKVWKSNDEKDEYQLLDDYEQYVAIEKYLRLKNDPSKKIDCLIITGINFTDAKKLSIRLQNISQKNENYLDRCLNIRLLIESELSKSEIKEIYGVKKSNSAEGKKFQRDYRIAECTPLLNRVLGINLSNEDESNTLMSLLKPRVREATLTYGQADRLLTIMGNNPKFINRFEEEYQKYIENIKEAYFSEEELTKPIFLWRNYNKKRVETIARISVRLGDQSEYKKDIFIEESKEKDVDWAFNVSETTYKVTYPQISFNLIDKDDVNIKKMVDLRYKTEKLFHSLDSYIKRIRPTEHGHKLRLEKLTVGATTDANLLNLPKLDDQSYFDYVRDNKLLHYCNKNHLLRSIELNSTIFGFHNLNPVAESKEEIKFQKEIVTSFNETTTFKFAFDCYTRWYEEKFMKQVREYYDGNHKRHPRYSIYISIYNVLLKKSNQEAKLNFKSFITLLFSEVFFDIDRSLKAKRETINRKLESDRSIKSALWDEIKVTLTSSKTTIDEKLESLKDILSEEWQEIEKAKKEIHSNESRVLAEIHKLENSLEQVSVDVENYFKPVKKGA